MRGLLPSMWLLGAALYTASIVSLVQPFSGNDAWPAPPPANETVRAKQPLNLPPKPGPEGTALTEQASAPVTQPRTGIRDEWVQIANYTTVVRSRPSAASPVVFAYSVGRPFRVIAREAGFVRVQDFGSGQLGWVKETSLVPFVGGYRQREPQRVEPQVAVVEPPATVARPSVAVAKPPYAVAAKPLEQPRIDAIAAQPRNVAAIEGWDRSIFRKKRDRPQPVVGRRQDAGLAAIMQRAFRGF